MNAIRDDEISQAPAYFSAWMCKQARKELHWAYSELAHNSRCPIRVVRNFEANGEASAEDQAKIYTALRKGGLDRLRIFAGILQCEYPALSSGPGSAQPVTSAT